MKKVTATGQTVEEAVESGLSQLQVTEDDVEIDVIDEGKRGLFGLFGSRPAIVKIIKKPDVIEIATEFLQNVMKNMGINAHIESVEKDERNVTFHITGEKMGLLIGKRGQTINSLQYLTQLVVNRQSKHYVTVILNPEDYRERRKNTLMQLAERLASKAHHLKRPVSLEPMPNYERKIIHTALSHHDHVSTQSKGEEPNRYVVINPK